MPLRRTVQRLLVALTLALYALLGPFGYAGFVVAALAPSRDDARRARLFQGAIFRGFRLMHRWLRWVGLIDHDPERFAAQLPAGPCLLVANHPTLTDVTVLMAGARDTVTLIRETTFDIWWLRPLLRAAGQIRSPLHVAGIPELHETMRRRFDQGFRVLVFPEGQRSFPDGTLRDFARAPFEAARLAGVPVVPVAIRAEPPYLTKTIGFMQPPPHGSRFTVRVLDALDPGEARSSRALRDEVRRILEADLGLCAREAV